MINGALLFYIFFRHTKANACIELQKQEDIKADSVFEQFDMDFIA